MVVSAMIIHFVTIGKHKIHFAIIFYFRCGIPVVIMGETGCGKTRLIRYMSDLVRQRKDATNMLILKVWVF